MARKTTEQVIAELEALGSQPKMKPTPRDEDDMWAGNRGRGCIRRDPDDIPQKQLSVFERLWVEGKVSVDDAIRISGIGPEHEAEARQRWARMTEWERWRQERGLK